MIRGVPYGLLMLLSAGCATTAPWTRGHAVLGVTAGTVIAVDCATTQAALQTYPHWREGNPLLGDRPSPGVLWTGCAMGATSAAIVADQLPPALRVTWLLLLTSLEVVMIGHNVGLWHAPLWNWIRSDR